MLKQLIFARKLKAVNYIGSEHMSIREFNYAFDKGAIYPQIMNHNKIVLPEEKTLLKNFVMIKVEGCGICGTDVHMYYGKRFLNEEAKENNPLIPGHEIFGKVVAAQDNFEYLLGQDIIIDPIMDCYSKNKCRFCRTDKNYMHIPFREMGICGSVPGGFAEYTVGLAKNCFETKSLSYKHKALIEPLSTLIYAFKYVMKLDSAPKRYLIIGSGPAGLLSLQYLKKLNQDNYIVLLDKNEFKLNVAKKLGADKVLCVDNLSNDEIVSSLWDISNGEGFEYILELSGSDEAIDLIAPVAAKLADVLLYGLGHKQVYIKNLDMIIEKEIKILSSLGVSNKNSFKEAIEIILDFEVDSIITNEYKGLDAIEDVMRKDYFTKQYIKGVLLV